MLDASARGAWETLVERLDAFIGRRLPREDVEDVRQDVLLRLHRSAPQLNDEAKFGPWVYTIARHAVIDRLRRRSPVTAADLPDFPAPETADVEDRPLLNCVTPFVARLPSPYREAITLTELQGLTQQDAAAMAGVSLSGMKSRIQRGRKMLRTMMEECCALRFDGRGRVIEAERHPAQPRCGCK
jgi:RNA polymerase sigma-70 factor (ECF subfamily)